MEIINCFELESGKGWKPSCDDDWYEEEYKVVGNEVKVGERTINGVKVIVFRCHDKVFRAQVKEEVNVQQKENIL